MATSVFILPIIPGKEDFDRETLQHMAAPGPEHDGYVATRRSQGITREAVWHRISSSPERRQRGCPPG